jgi:branched-subunit amino acid transport protein
VTTVWAAIVAATVGCYALKLVGVSLPETILNHPRVQHTAALLPVAMLTALVTVDLVDTNSHYHLNAPLLAGVTAGAIALRLDRPLPLVLLAAVATTAALRLVS